MASPVFQRLWVLSCLCLLISARASRQIPKVDGVLGGVRSTPVVKEAAATPLVSGKPVAGKMRYIENSGVCGQ